MSATAAASATNVKDSMMTTTTSMTTVAPAERETGMDEDKGATSATSSSSSSSSSSSTSSRSSTRTVAHDQDPAKNDGASDGRMTFPGETWFTTSLPVFGGAAAAPPVLGVNVTAPSLPSESSSRGVLVPETLPPSSFSFPTIPAPTAGGTTTHSTYSHRHQSQRHHLPRDFPDGERISAWDLHPITLHQSHILFPLTGVTSTDSSIVDVGSTRPTKSKSKRRGRRKKKKERKQDRDEKPDSDPNDQPDDGNKEDRSQTCNHCPKYPGSGSESVI